MYRWFFLFSLLSSALFAEKTPLFTPPPKWQIADPEMLSPRVQIGFLTKGKQGFCPSINLSSEAVNLSLEEYVKVVMGLHSKKGVCRDLGPMKVNGGMGRLLQLESSSKFGPLRLMQLVTVWEGKAYVLTGCARKEDFGSYVTMFEKAFRSLQLTDNLHSLLDEKRYAALKKSEQSVIAAWQKYSGGVESLPTDRDFQKAWKPHEKMVVKEFSDLGAHFQVLLLKQLEEKIHNEKTNP